MGNCRESSLPTVCFGCFEADLNSRRLLKNGLRIPLQEQPFEILATLLSQPGRVFSREELREKVWEPGIAVDFERGLNKAVNRLREALGDSPDHPLFIETVPKHGYRFIAAVQQPIRSIAVLPLDNVSCDAGQDYWAVGLTDELIAHLSRRVNNRVISRTSVMRFRNTQAPPAEIGRQLGVDTLIDGSVSVSAGRVRVRVSLVDVVTGRSIWAETYERETSDMVAVQGQIAEELARRLHPRLTPLQKGDASARVLPAAYEAYLKGRFFWNQRTEGSLAKSLDYFNRAIDLDPCYAAPLAGLADVYIVLGILGLRVPAEVFPRARAAAERALALDPYLPGVHESLAAVLSHYDWQWREAEHEFQLALELNPNSTAAHQWYAGLLILTGRRSEAIAEAMRARDLDPLSPLQNAFVGLVHMKARRQQEAIKWCREALELDANHAFSRLILARVLDAQGDLHEALRESEKAAELAGEGMPYAAYLGYVHARLGNRAQAFGVLKRLQELGARRHICAYDIGLIYMALEEKELAFEWFERAFRERAVRLCELGDPAFDQLRSEPKFQDLARRIALPLHADNS